MTAKDYVIEISAPAPTYLGSSSDEGDPIILPRTTDPVMALRFDTMKLADKECKHAVKLFPAHSFRVNVLPKLQLN